MDELSRFSSVQVYADFVTKPLQKLLFKENIESSKRFCNFTSIAYKNKQAGGIWALQAFLQRISKWNKPWFEFFHDGRKTHTHTGVEISHSPLLKKKNYWGSSNSNYRFNDLVCGWSILLLLLPPPHHHISLTAPPPPLLHSLTWFLYARQRRRNDDIIRGLIDEKLPPFTTPSLSTWCWEAWWTQT